MPEASTETSSALKIGQLKMPSNRTGRRDGTLPEDAGWVRKGSRPQVMAVPWDSLIELDSFSGEASLAAANRHDMCHPETLVEFPSTNRRMKRPWKTG